MRPDTSASSPALGATVSVNGTALGATTDADGRFRLEPVPAGSVVLRVRLQGFRTADRAVRVRAGDTVRVDVTLLPEVQLLSPIRADARSADVEMFVSRPNIGTVALTATAMAGLPSVGEPDVVRVMQLLPGVVA